VSRSISEINKYGLMSDERLIAETNLEIARAIEQANKPTNYNFAHSEFIAKQLKAECTLTPFTPLDRNNPAIYKHCKDNNISFEELCEGREKKN
jgi:hypothetical protein